MAPSICLLNLNKNYPQRVSVDLIFNLATGYTARPVTRYDVRILRDKAPRPCVKLSSQRIGGAVHWVSTQRTWYVNLSARSAQEPDLSNPHKPIISWTPGSLLAAHQLTSKLRQIETPPVLAAMVIRRYLLLGGLNFFYLWVRSWQSRIGRLVCLILQPLTDAFVHNLTNTVIIDFTVTWSRGAKPHDVWSALGTFFAQHAQLLCSVTSADSAVLGGTPNLSQLRERWFRTIIRSKIIIGRSRFLTQTWAPQQLFCLNVYFSQRSAYTSIRNRNYSRIKKRITKKLVKQTQRRLWVF